MTSTQPQPIYLTTTLPYVNARPHLGFALEIVTADVLARYWRALGHPVLFNTGTDEHGQKIWQKAQELNQDPQEFVDQASQLFADLKTSLNLSFTHFTRTSQADHQNAARAFWRQCQEGGFIYKKHYQTLYCVGCELEKQRSDLEDGHCPLHPQLQLEQRDEENYFFRFSQFAPALLQLYQERPDFVIPASKQAEIQSFVAAGLQDFSISRLKSKMPWGIPVPDDDEHVIYVWFDALVNYISALGWPNQLEQFQQWWPVIQLAGKDNLRQQAAIWQAMLLAAGLPPSKQILINGFISVDGQKMSKSIGNVVEPNALVAKYGIDATRFLLINLGPVGADIDLTTARLDRDYTTWLVNGVGNLFSRLAKLCAAPNLTELTSLPPLTFTTDYQAALAQFDFNALIALIRQQIQDLDHYLSREQPWTLPETKRLDSLRPAVIQLRQLATHLAPIMPQASQTILTHFQTETVTPVSPLFPRLKSS